MIIFRLADGVGGGRKAMDSDMFVDSAKIYIEAGKGGNGRRREGGDRGHGRWRGL